jgi:hypothetical protein
LDEIFEDGFVLGEAVSAFASAIAHRGLGKPLCC